MSETPHEAALVRRQSFETEGPVELDVTTGAGRIELRLVDEPGVHVEVRHEAGEADPFAEGVASLVTWISQFTDAPPAELPAEAVRQTRIELSAGRLVVRTPKDLQLRSVPVSVSVRAPAGCHVEARTGSGNLRVSGAAGRLSLTTGSGRINADQSSGTARVDTGSGAVHLGPLAEGVRLKTGSGDVEITALGATSTVVTGSGDVWLGAVTGDVLVRTGTGAITVANATTGDLELHTGSGAIRVGVHAGSPAEVDLSSGSGEARSELSLSGERPDHTPGLRVRGRTGSGTALVAQAAD